MKRRFGFLISVYILLFFTYSDRLYSQRSDLASWIYIEADITGSHWQGVLSGEFRLKDNIGKVDLYSGGLFGYYLFSKAFKMGVGYEYFANDLGSGKLESEHRTMIQSVVQYPVANFKLAWRSSFMDTFYKLSDPNFGVRNRLKADYYLEKVHLKPFVYTEIYHELESGIKHQKNRYATGINYMIKNNQQFDLYYMIEDYHSRKFTRHVIGLGYCISI